MNTTNSLRHLSRRSFQCLRTPPRPLPTQSSPLIRYAITRNIVFRRGGPTGRVRVGDFKDVNEMMAPVRNPLDTVTTSKREAARRQYYIRKMKFNAFGLLISLACLGFVMYMVPMPTGPGSESADESERKAQDGTGRGSQAQGGLKKAFDEASSSLLGPTVHADASDEANATFQGRPVVVAGGGAKIVAKDERSGEQLELIPTGTSTVPHFPKTIHLPSRPNAPDNETEYTLLGLGIRTVTFLGIQVYVVGLYVQTSSLADLQSALIKRINPMASALIPGEKEELKASLLSPQHSYGIWEDVLRETGGELNTAIRVVPVRNTDFQHLRDGFVKGITDRTRGKGEYQDDAFGKAMKDFQSLFGGRGKAPKGSILLLTRGGDGSLRMLYQGKEGLGALERIGEVKDERVARQVWLGYVGGKNVSSEAVRKSVVDGVMELVERPVGTVETRVA